MNALPMWRKNAGRHAMDQLRERLLDGECGYILFPEGTRSRSGEMNKFRAGIGMLLVGTSIPVIPCRIEGTHIALPPEKRFPRRANLSVRIGKAILFENIANERKGWEEVAELLEQAVLRLNPCNKK